MPETLLIKQPTLSAEALVFLYAGDLWIAQHDGSQPRRLTAQRGAKLNPSFSPDGEWIAFSGNYDGSLSVYVVHKNGGSPRRLTHHPAEHLVRGWTSDGQHILFASHRDAPFLRKRRLFTVPREGGYPTPLPMDTAERGAFSPDGKRLAYTPYFEAFWSWKRYRGGRTVPIWVIDLNSHEHIEIPHVNASDTLPCWLDETIYFLSDRDHTMNVFRYNLADGKVEQVTFHTDFDVRSLSAGAGLLAHEQGGRAWILNPTNGQSAPVPIEIAADLPYTRPHFQHVGKNIKSAYISPTGMRVALEARGEIFTVPAKKGEIRNLSRSPGSAERSPAWSPDGQSLAYFSDASGEYELVITDQKGESKTSYALGKPSFFYNPVWSPDSKKIAFTDKTLQLSYFDLESKNVVAVDSDTYDHPERSLNPIWSPDSQWLVYTKRLDNHLRAVFLYHLPDRQIHQVTDGMSDATDACFSLDGKLLFFAASANYGLNTGWLDLSSYDRPFTRSLYVTVLSQADASPLAPESDDEKPPEANSKPVEGTPTEGKAAEADKKPSTPSVRIDIADLGQRILALPIPARHFHHLQAAEGKLFYLETIPNQTYGPELPVPLSNLQAYDLKERKSEVFVERILAYNVSADGKKLLYVGEKTDQLTIVETAKKPEPGKDKLDLSAFEMLVNPQAEWRQMFREAYRIHRDFFYDAGLHGLDLEAAYQKYLPFLEHIGHRDDLNYLLAEFSGELVVGHAYVGFGDIPAPDPVPVGLLGADYEVVDGHYRIQRILPGLNWHPELRSPLTEPGVNAKEGDYLLAVNGQTLTTSDEIYSLFQKTAERLTELRVGPAADGTDSRTVTVKPIANEIPLRHWNWIESNRLKVRQLTDGRVGYVYLPNTAIEGYESFNRYFFSQLDKAALVVDERYNGGGYMADYVIDFLSRPLLSYWATREGKPFATPNGAIFGPKVMIINELAGSGGDALPYFFRLRQLGKLVGKRTWGGLVGIYDYPELLDGGFFTSPRLGIFSPQGEWIVENEGVAPDIEVEMTPKLVIEGHDPQLEKAVEVVLAELAAHPPPRPTRPAPAQRVQ